MNRRKFAIISGSAVGALAYATQPNAASASPDPGLLTTTLTPLGAERAGNAAGTIPAWSGGLTAIPVASGWNPAETLPPDFFASDTPLYTVDASNLAQYAHLLSDGVQYMVQNKDFSLKVYPTRRTAAAPQWLYDNTAKNIATAQLNPGGGRLGFSNAFGGTPFPIPDTSDPFVAGAQIVWNHEARWEGSDVNLTTTGYVIASGAKAITQCLKTNYTYPYNQKAGSIETFDGYLYKVYGYQTEPATAAGQQIVSYNSANPLTLPNVTWELLQGQGRVRKTPDVGYDVPNSFNAGIINYDETYGFNGAMDEYDWKYLGKQEMLIPYNNNKLFNITNSEAIGPKFLNPDVVRWELHRVWVVEATLHPGERNVLARRRLYLDEDTWRLAVVDGWDAHGNIFHHGTNFNVAFPNLPGVLFANNVMYNLQTNDYCVAPGPWAEPMCNQPWSFTKVDPSVFNPQSMAAAANY